MSLFVSLLIATLANAPAELPELVEVPAPDLAALEPAVAEQLAATDELLRAELAMEGTPAERLAASYGDLAQLYHAYELYDAAQASYRNARALAGEDFRWPYLLGHVYQSEGQLDEAARWYERALAMQPADIATLIHLGRVYLELNRPEAASARLERALELAPGDPAARAGLGDVALSEKRYDDAIAHLEAALEAVPEADRLHHPLGLAYRGLGEMDRAREHLGKRGQVGVRPADPLMEQVRELVRGERVFLLRGRLAFGAGRYEEARNAFAAAVEANPESVPSLVNLGTTIGLLGDSDAAAEQFRRVLELAPENVAALFNLGHLMLERGELDAAHDLLSRAVTLDPSDGMAALDLAHIFRRRGDSESALNWYRRAAGIAPRADDAHLGIASLCIEAGDYGCAVNQLESGLGLSPHSGRLNHAMARLLAGSPDPTFRNGERALTLAQSVMRASATPGHAETLAMALAETGQCAEAASTVQQIIDAFPDLADRLGPSLERYRSGPPCRPPVEE